MQEEQETQKVKVQWNPLYSGKTKENKTINFYLPCHLCVFWHNLLKGKVNRVVGGTKWASEGELPLLVFFLKIKIKILTTIYFIKPIAICRPWLPFFISSLICCWNVWNGPKNYQNRTLKPVCWFINLGGFKPGSKLPPSIDQGPLQIYLRL